MYTRSDPFSTLPLVPAAPDLSEAISVAVTGLLLVGAVLLLLTGVVVLMQRLLHRTIPAVYPTLRQMPPEKPPEELAAVIAAAICAAEDPDLAPHALEIELPQPDEEAQLLWAAAGRYFETTGV